MNAIIIEIQSAGWYQGHNIMINGNQVAHRKYDGAHSDVVEMEVAAAFGALLREKTGWPLMAPDDEEGW